MNGIQAWARHTWLGLGLLGFLMGAWGPWARYPYTGTVVEQQLGPGTGGPVVALVWSGFTNLEFHAQQTRSIGNLTVHRVVVSSLAPNWVLVSNELSGIQRRPVQVKADLSARGLQIRWRWGVVGALVGSVLGAMLRWPSREAGASGGWVVGMGVGCVVVFSLTAKWIRGGQPAGDEPALRQAADEFRGSIVLRYSVDRPYTNSLGQKFVPVPGTKVLFCIWETRVRDFEAFVKENGAVGADGWRSPGWKQEPDFPVVNVSYEDAEKFCQWLTRRERSAGRIGERDVYRLPTDAEWSAAVGPGKYPWGDYWRPRKGDGNYFGEEFGRTDYVLEGYQDRFEYTAPVGSFKTNRYGLYDMGGNVWEFVRGKSGLGKQYRVLRGASWGNVDPVHLESSFRVRGVPQLRYDSNGFRCVLGAEVAR